MKRQPIVAAALTLVLVLGSSPAFAQAGGTSSITGTVTDVSGGVVPGATVTVRNVATGVSFTVLTGSNGTYAVPVVTIGTYSVTVTLDGFKTVLLEDVLVTAAGPATAPAVLEVGELTETIVVKAAGAIVQTQAATVSSRISVDEIANLPLSSRNVLSFVVNLPGVVTLGNSRESTINGLQRSSINVTLDGINVQDNTRKTQDGFFAIVNPRLDAIEEITVNSAAQTADMSGTGAVQIKFVTRSGSNTYTGSIYHYLQRDWLNANTYFNIRDGVDKPELTLNQMGGRIGGPVVIPGLFDGHNRVFFFVNYEEFRQPKQVTRNRSILTPEAQAGLFRYNVAGEVRSVDLYALAAANGLPSTPDPTTAQLLIDIRNATRTTGVIVPTGDPNVERYTWNVEQRVRNRYPTVRIDWNLSDRHRLSSAINWQYYYAVPDTLNGRDPRFPGFPATASQQSTRIGFSNALRSTLGANLVNELRVGGSGAPVHFFPEMNISMFTGPLANQKGFLLGINTARITNASAAGNWSARNAYLWLVENTVNWQKGNHGLNLGGKVEEVYIWMDGQNYARNVRFDQVTGTLGDRVFGKGTNIPGGSSTDRNDAEDLYSVLVGSIDRIGGYVSLDAATGYYVSQGTAKQEGRLRDYALWIQDAWRPRTDLTINLGLRYEFQTPFQALNNSYSGTTLEDVWGISGYVPGCDVSNVTPETCNIFKPGLMPGKAETEYYQLDKGTNLFDMDWDNLAPSVGIAWTPSSEGPGWLADFLGSPGDTVFRAGWSRAFQRNGMSDFTVRLNSNPGLVYEDVDRDANNGNLLPPGAEWLLLRDGDLSAPPFPLTRDYPMTDAQTADVTWFDPHLQVPYADTWSAGWQRALSRNMAVEIRYVGTRGRDLWYPYDYNEVNIHENGVLAEFLLAQQNLQANLAAGRGGTFAYMGPGTGTQPLPIALAYFQGVPASMAGNPSLYTSSSFRSTTYLNPLAMRNPNVFAFADALDSTASNRNRALAAGLPDNFLVVNPNKLGGAEVTGNGGFTSYHSLQVEVRRRMASGLQFQASYVYGLGYTADFYSFRVARLKSRSSIRHRVTGFGALLLGGNEGGATHAVKANWLFELPFGQGRRWFANAGPVLDRIIGGWQIHGIARLQTGEMLDWGNVRMVGFDIDDLQDMIGVYKDADGIVTFLPADVQENTIKAFSTSPTSADGYSALGPPTGRYFAPASGPDCLETISPDYGTCGGRAIQVAGPVWKDVDLSVVKLVPIKGRVRAEFRVEMLNAFNWVNFDPFATTSANPDDWQATGLLGDVQARIVQLVARVTW